VTEAARFAATLTDDIAIETRRTASARSPGGDAARDSARRRRRWLIALVLGTLMLLGAGIRLEHLESRGIGHVESYTPGLPFPDGISSPEPRLTLGRAISGPMFEEPHPPAWYAAMWPWTRVFGTDLFTIRLPSVCFGVAAIGLIFWLGSLAHSWPTGLVAAGFLAFNGHHLLFSQVARPTSMAVFLSILSTTLLLLISRGAVGKRLGVFVSLYLVVTFIGLATLYYFWPVLAAQMVWVALRGAGASVGMQRMLRFQWLLVILGSPLLTLAVFQQFNSFLDSDGLGVMVQFLDFGFLFEPDNFGLLSTQAYIPDTMRLALPFVCAALIALGIVRTRWRTGSATPMNLPGLDSRWLAIAAILAFATILLEIAFFEHHRPGRLIRLLATGLVPLIILGGLWLAARRPFEPLLLKVRAVQSFPTNSVALMYVMSVVPVAIITGVSLFIPFFASRHMLLFTPYLLIITSRGVVELFNLGTSRVFRLACAVFVAALLAVHLSSLAYSRDRLVTRVDYKGLAAQWIPDLQPNDLIMLQPHWATTPIFYYLDCSQHTCVGSNYAAAIEQDHPSRIWVLSAGGVRIPPDTLDEALVAFHHLGAVQAEVVQADLYESNY
jgi:hypothetical protein